MILNKNLLIIAFSVLNILVGGVTGKVSGKITDSISNEPLIGVNVMLVGTTLGSATDQDGFYHILNVPPNRYELKASMIGYGEKIITDVRVEIDLTAFIDVSLSEKVIESEMVVVEANQQLVKVDVASSQKSISSEEIAEMPVSSVSEVVCKRWQF